MARSHVLLDDPELAQHLPDDRRTGAMRDCVASEIRLPAGPWTPRRDAETMRFGIGLLLLEGLIVRRVGVAGRFGAELLGEGDLIRPWQREDAGTTLPRTGRWRVLSPCRIAVLDSGFASRLAHYPELFAAFMARAVRRSRHMAVTMAIVHQPRVDVRLHMLLWDLADRWGTVHPDGVHVPFNLTHAVLADLVAAQRPTVSRALGELTDRDLLRWVDDGCVLYGDPPTELQAVGSVSVKRV